MLKIALSRAALRNSMPQTGQLVWIGLRPGRGLAVNPVTQVYAEPSQGLIGDRHRGSDGKRQVTLLQAEHLPVIAALLAREQALDPLQLRRNLLIRGINLLALQDCRFRIGEVILAGTGLAHPCAKMELALGSGGFNALRGHGGITARIERPGLLKIGDPVRLLNTTADRDD